MIFVFAAIAFLVSGFLMSRLVGLSLKRWTIPSAFWWAYIVMIFVPAFFVYADHHHPARDPYLVAVISVLFTVPLGVFVANILGRFGKKGVVRFWEAPVEDDAAGLSRIVPYLVLLGLAVGVTFLYLSEIKIVPLFYMIANVGDYREILQLREDSFKLLASSYYFLYFITRGVIYPLLILLGLGYALWTRRWGWRALAGLSLAFGLFYASLTTAKMPVAAIVVVACLFYYLYRRSRVPMTVLYVSLALVLGWSLYIVLSLQSGSGVSFGGSVLGIAKRLFYYPAEDIYYYFEYFPNVHGYLFGRSIGKLATLAGLQYFDTPNMVGQYAHPEFVSSINMNAGFIADLNADFGLAGVLIGGLIAGLIMQSVQIYLCRRGKNIPTLALYAFMTYAFWLLLSMSLPVVLLSGGVVFSLLLIWLFRGAQMILKRAAPRSSPP
jgi:oligosaccharide repeat unit polymerase